NVAESPAQLISTNGPSARGDSECISSASFPLPVPVSPCSSTVASTGASTSTRCATSRMTGVSPSSANARASSWRRRSRYSVRRRRSAFSIARRMIASRCRRSNGFSRKFSAPSCMASTAGATAPYPLNMMTGMFGSRSLMICSTASPLIPGSCRSSSTMSNAPPEKLSSASSADAATVTSQSGGGKASSIIRRISASSSTTSTLALMACKGRNVRGQRANGRPALRENRPERRGDPRETGLPVAPSWELALSWVGPTLYNGRRPRRRLVSTGRRLRFRLLEQMTEPARILVVDEDADHLDIVATLLDHHGYRVELETTPEAGLEAAQRNPPDAIITALHFGGLPAGLSFIDRLRESRETASIPI